MPLDPTLVRGLTPISMPQRDPNAAINQLGAIMKIQGLQNEMQANQLQAQKYQQDIATGQATERKARLESKIGAFRNGAALAGEDPTALMGLISTAAQDPDMAEALGIGPQQVQFIGSQLNDPAKVSILARRMRGMTAKEEADIAKPSDRERMLMGAGLTPGTPAFQAAMQKFVDNDLYRAPTEAGKPPADVQTVQWLMTQPPEVQALYSNMFGKGQMTPYQAANLKIEQDKEARIAAEADAKKEAAARAAESTAAGAEESARIVTGAITKAKGLVSPTSTGFGSLLSGIPTTDARALEGQLNVIKANLGFDRLRQMREESKTGGALGSIAVKELERLEAAVATLDTGLKGQQLINALDAVSTHYNNWLTERQKLAKKTGGAPAGGQNAPAPAKNFTYVPGKGLVPQ